MNLIEDVMKHAIDLNIKFIPAKHFNVSGVLGFLRELNSADVLIMCSNHGKDRFDLIFDAGYVRISFSVPNELDLSPFYYGVDYRKLSNEEIESLKTLIQLHCL